MCARDELDAMVAYLKREHPHAWAGYLDALGKPVPVPLKFWLFAGCAGVFVLAVWLWIGRGLG